MTIQDLKNYSIARQNFGIEDMLKGEVFNINLPTNTALIEYYNPFLPTHFDFLTVTWDFGNFTV